jgi:acetyltransferase-like isoleucine patch superfamily enzyme
VLRLRVSQADCLTVLNLHGGGVSVFPNVWLRSARQTLFWGSGSTAVNLNVVELEGVDRSLSIGDDALFSSGIVIRSFDMHAIVDLATGTRQNSPINITIERHVWLGQDVLLLGCESIGYGSIIGARSFVKGAIPAKVIAAGSPAKVLATNRSWGRGIGGMTQVELNLVSEMDRLADQHEN